MKKPSAFLPLHEWFSLVWMFTTFDLSWALLTDSWVLSSLLLFKVAFQWISFCRCLFLFLLVYLWHRFLEAGIALTMSKYAWWIVFYILPNSSLQCCAIFHICINIIQIFIFVYIKWLVFIYTAGSFCLIRQKMAGSFCLITDYIAFEFLSVW